MVYISALSAFFSLSLKKKEKKKLNRMSVMKNIVIQREKGHKTKACAAKKMQIVA